MTSTLVTDALRMAWFRRHLPAGLIVHSDRGAQHCSKAFQKALKAYGMKSSMSRKADCWDNSATESLWRSLKRARVQGITFKTRDEAKAEVMDWPASYNAISLHSTLGCTSPINFEKSWWAAQPRKSA